MKLKYVMREESHRLVAVDPVYHDAALAHALVMAMKEQPYTTSDVYINRADKIMASWGYGED